MPAVTEAQRRDFAEKGFFIARGVCDLDVVSQLRGVVRNWMATPDPSAAGVNVDLEPIQPGDISSFVERMARYRKFNRFGSFCPLMWEECIVGPWAGLARSMLGDDVLLKFSSAFVKQPGGAETPWHQDNGIWRDDNVDCFSVWMALDPATRANGCLQFIPRSHEPELREAAVVRHVLYEDSVHCELPVEAAAEAIADRGVEHIELAPGDAVCWHDSLWHYSPPNESGQSRIGIAGVFTTPQTVEHTASAGRGFASGTSWVLKQGVPQHGFPPEGFQPTATAPSRVAPLEHPQMGPRPALATGSRL
jgi:phytanoyl-CoA hydroxylase